VRQRAQTESGESVVHEGGRPGAGKREPDNGRAGTVTEDESGGCDAEAVTTEIAMDSRRAKHEADVGKTLF
jgi:hypothetical protein